MPANHPFLGALSARFRRQRLLIVGCGDVGLRVLAGLPEHVRVLAMTSSPERGPALRAAGAQVLQGDLDRPPSLRRLAGLATRVLHLAPPPGQGDADPRSIALVRALARGVAPRALVYGSTSGVYGDCGGAFVAETRAVAPTTDRARRRVAAEAAVRGARRTGMRAVVLRIPGIYAADRIGGTPEARLRKGTPVLRASEDVFTNHIHADDLARACRAALWHGAPQRVYHVSDDAHWRMGDYFDRVADLLGLPRPPRIDRAEAQQTMSPMQLSFLGESRRLSNRRLRGELGVSLRFADPVAGLRDLADGPK